MSIDITQREIFKLLSSVTRNDLQTFKDQALICNARETLLDFITYRDKDFIVNWHHRLICSTIDDFLADPERDALMIFAPPRHTKSEIISRNLPAFYSGRFPDKKIIHATYAGELAKAFNNEVRNIMQSKEYRRVFPNSRIGQKAKLSSNSDLHYADTSNFFQIANHKGYQKHTSVMGTLTGFGSDLGLIDDPIKDMEEANSPTRNQKIYDWYHSVFSTRAMPDAKQIIMLTRWTQKDLAGRLLADAEKDTEAQQWEVLCLPQTFEANHAWKHPQDPRSEGEHLWPEYFSEKKMNRRKATTPRKIWASLYQQSPVEDGGALFKAEYFKYFQEIPDISFLVLSIDCAFKETDTSDYVAMGVWGVAGADKYLMHVVRERLDFPATLLEINKILKEFKKFNMVIVEEKANGAAVISTIKSKVPAVIPYNPKESKVSRANSVLPQFMAGNIHLPDPYYEKNRIKFPWCVKGVDIYINELLSFPSGANDDLVDMTSQALIKIGEKPSWLYDFTEGKELAEDDAIKSREQVIADLMGWQLDEEDGNDGNF